MTNQVQTIPIQDVIDAVEARGSHFFEKAAMRFFNSRTSAYAFQIGNIAYFVTSERCTLMSCNCPRLYTIRAADMTTGRGHTIGEFQQYTTGKQAHRALRDLILDETLYKPCASTPPWVADAKEGESHGLARS